MHEVFFYIYMVAFVTNIIQWIKINEPFYDVICLTQRHDQFEHSNCSKETFF